MNLSSNGDGDLQWIVGLYQYSQKWDQPQGIRVVGDNAILNPLGAPANPSGAFLAVDGHLETDSYAGFGQMDWSFADKWTYTLGLRYTKDKKTGIDMARYVARTPGYCNRRCRCGADARERHHRRVSCGHAAFIHTNAGAKPLGPIVAAAVLAQTQALALDVTQTQVCGAAACAPDLLPNPGGGLRRNLAGDWDAVTGTTGLQWEPTDDMNLYLRYSRGYKSGGWLGSNGLTPNPYADPEYVDSYEFGLKTVLADRVQLNTAVFYSNYDGFQTPLTVLARYDHGQPVLELAGPSAGCGSGGDLVADRSIAVVGGVIRISMRRSLAAAASSTHADPDCAYAGSPASQRAAERRRSTDAGGQSLCRRRRSTRGPWVRTIRGASRPGSLTASGMYTDTDDQQSTIWINPIYTAPSFEVADFRLLWNDAREPLHDHRLREERAGRD